TYPHLDPEQAADQTRALWGLGQEPAPNMIHLLEARGVRVFSLPPDCQDADAFSAIRRGTPYVFLSTRKTAERGRFDAAHELGHLVLHCEHASPRPQAAEPEANAFASAFLMPRAGLLAQQLHNAGIDRILQAKRRWGDSAMALTYRMHNLGLLTEWRYRQTARQLAEMGYRTSEPDSRMPRESSQLLAKVFQALRARHISTTDLANAVNIPPQDLNEYVFGLVPTPIHGGY
ncbi:ImmA/IrrE family metallo-endopeptidase, partial [Streptomyces calidiresistens]